METKTLNATFKLPAHEVVNFENWFRHNVEVVDFKILPNTEKLYETDKHFQKMVKQEKAFKKAKEQYINEHNH